MQKSGCGLFSFRRREEESTSSYGHKRGSSFSQASTCNRSGAGSTNLSDRSPLRHSTGDSSSSFISCFNPGNRKTRTDRKGSDQEHHSTQTYDVSSSSGSKVSTTSSTAHSTFKCTGSKSTDGTRTEETQFSISEISKATGNFSEENVIGQGAFGTVYKGKLMDGTLVAVKRAKKKFRKGISPEFMNEIKTLSKVEHFNLVKLIGILDHSDEQIIVVELVGNGTLRDHLDGTREYDLELSERLDIAIDVAHAITYLHTYTDQPIIHRDIKASNILLTENLRAKVADFGFARLAADDPDATHISTQVKGTAGYLDPEYLRTYQLTEKSDVYSFGVLLVELVTGRHPIESGRDLKKDRMTTRWAIQKFRQREVVLAMDTRLRRSPASIGAVDEMMALAYACLASPRKSRPSMKHCAEVLWGIRRNFRAAQLAAAAPRPAAGELHMDESIIRD